jgi:hypothetical protein
MKTRCIGTRIRFRAAQIHERENVVSTCRKQVRAGAIAQTFLSAGSLDIPVPCKSGDKNVAQPAGRNACSTSLILLVLRLVSSNPDQGGAGFIHALEPVD